MTDALLHPPSNYINGQFRPIPGETIVSRDPSDPERVIWSGGEEVDHLDEAVAAAQAALPTWSSTSFEDRRDLLLRWKEVTGRHVDALAGLITDEMGKTLAESRFEAAALAAKVDITLGEHSLGRVTEYDVPVNETRSGRCRYKPFGVMSVIGPFNFPAHLANGQVLPALLTGNTVVFKPSEKTPGVGQKIAEMMEEAGAPAGVFNLVQGGPAVASGLVNHEDIDGILFTGSWPVGRKILEANLDRPGRIIALEMGGNNPAVVLDDAPLKLAVLECVRASFATTGQRCTCTRRIIVQRGIADRFISAYCKAASTLLVGPGRSETPVFMGPLVTAAARESVLNYQRGQHDAGARVLVEATALDRPGHFITPGVIEVDRFTIDRDCEVFGPLAQICIVDNLDEAIEQSNATRYGLAAAIFTRDETSFERFFHRVNSGCVNWNNGTAGATGKLPFGGRGFSGNNRPAGAFASDFCAYPVASMVERAEDLATPGGVQWDDDWLK